LKWPGGKAYLAPKLWEIAKRVPHVHRVEVYGGSLAFTLASEPEGYSEVVNDLNGELMNFWKVIQHKDCFAEFCRRMECQPFSEQSFREAEKRLRFYEVDVDHAAHFFIRCRQSLAGRMDTFAPLSRNRTRRNMNEQASAWLSAIDGLPEVHARLKRVVILNRDALECIKSQDGPKTLFYCDPPYLHETRAGNGEYGEFEMTVEQHAELLRTLAFSIQGKFMLSGYRSELYDEWAETHGWYRQDFNLPNNAAGGKEKRRMTECVWTNFEVTP